MKRINLYRLLISTLVIVFTGFGYANANISSQEEIKNAHNRSIQYLDQIEIDDVFCTEADPNKVFIILDHYDKVITQGRCNDIMVKFFLSISDPLFEVDNIKYFRLEYANPALLKTKLFIED
jgi:hypothetical protein